MKKRICLLLVALLCAGLALAFAESAPTLPTADECLAEYLQVVAGMEEGTAGASLKQALAARDVLRFAMRCKPFWDTNALRDNLLQALEGMSQDDQTAFNGNLRDIIAPTLEGVFANYDEVAGTFDDAGAGEDMASLSRDPEAKAAWEDLLGNTLTLGNSD